MDRVVESKRDCLKGICEKFAVRRLAIFGSAAEGRFRPGTSDVDALVEFEPMPPSRHADCYFCLLDELEALFGAPVDLVEPSGIQNPYLRRSVESQKVVVYESA